jgi:hypothetical protein
MGLGKTALRVGAGVMTGGASELAIRGADKMGLTKAAPTRKVEDIDNDTKALMDEQQGRANRSLDEIADEQLQGTQNFAGEASDAVQDQNRYATNLAMQEPDDFNDALLKRASKSFGSAQKNLKTQAKLNAGDYKAQQMSQGAQYAAEKSGIALKAQQAAREAAQAKKAQRAALYGAVFGAAGAVTGAYLGGPKGAATGAQAGTGVGQLAAPQK